MGKASAQIEITAGSSRLASGLSAAYSKFQTFGSAVARGMSAAFKKINAKLAPGDVMKNAIGHAGGDLIGKGIGAITSAAGDVRDFERSLIRYQIASGGSAEATAALRSQIRGVSLETGISSAEVLAGASSYVALTGDVEGARDAMSAFARISQASGSSVSDVATATAALKQSMKIDGSQVEAAFSGLIVQGKQGAVEIKDFAGELATLSPQFAQFGNTGLGGLREMGAAFQVIRQGAGTAGEAATQFQAMMGELVTSHKELAAIGIKVFQKNPQTGRKELKNFTQIAEELASNKALNDPAKLAKIFGRKESQAAVRTIRSQIDAMKGLAKAGEDTGAVQRDLSTFLESDAGRMDAAFNRVKVTIAEAFTPERITAFVNAIEGLVDKLGPVVDLVGKAADVLGGIAGVGKKLVEFSSDNANANPWGNALDDIADRNIAENDGDWLVTPDGQWVKRDSAQGRGHTKAASLRVSNRAAYNRAVGDIMGGEVDERTTKESIRRAYFAAAADPSKEGGLGLNRAGSRYLEAAGITKAQAGEQIGKDMAAALTKSNAELVAAIKAIPGINVKVGDDTIAKSERRSKEPRRRPQ